MGTIFFPAIVIKRNIFSQNEISGTLLIMFWIPEKHNSHIKTTLVDSIIHSNQNSSTLLLLFFGWIFLYISLRTWIAHICLTSYNNRDQILISLIFFSICCMWTLVLLYVRRKWICINHTLGIIEELPALCWDMCP